MLPSFCKRLIHFGGVLCGPTLDLWTSHHLPDSSQELSEIVPKNLRGALGSVDQLSVTIDLFLAYLMGMFVRWRLLKILPVNIKSPANRSTILANRLTSFVITMIAKLLLGWSTGV
ncbi:hypothetical protein C4D60_Mb06t23290 [Musa balbisiana]|uniref:Uncharacterized protein n=1 Tax=Musa balbisiana TaxID=52838 RepID=A0A4S8IQ46_MUSBA|nr:hypothetical protein C4D60_Mb06t23290 [Musa balbisiana]